MSNETNGTKKRMSEIPVEEVDEDVIDPSGSYDYEFGQLFFNINPERNRLSVKDTETRSVDIREIFEFISKNVQYIHVKDGKVTQITKDTAKDMLKKKSASKPKATTKKEASKKPVSSKSESTLGETQKPKTVKKVVKKKKPNNNIER